MEKNQNQQGQAIGKEKVYGQGGEIRNKNKSGYTLISNYVIEMIPALSPVAFMIYVYLRKLGNKTYQSFPSYATIRKSLGIGSDSTVKRGLDELVERGLLHIENRFRDGTKDRTSNLYTLFDEPSPRAGHVKLMQKKKKKTAENISEIPLKNLPENQKNIEENLPEIPKQEEIKVLQKMENPSTNSVELVLQKMENPSTNSVDELYPINYNQFNYNHLSERVEPSTEFVEPAKGFEKTNRTRPDNAPINEDVPSVYVGGEMGTVMMSIDEHQKLIKDYGEELTQDYIMRVDLEQAGRGMRYDSCYATIKKWIRQDTERKKEKEERQKREEEREKSKTRPRPNAFSNFKQREVDYSKIEQQNREHLMRNYYANKAKEKEQEKQGESLQSLSARI